MTIQATSSSNAPAAPELTTGPVRGWVARHPLTTFTALVFGIGWPVLSIPALTAHGLLPGGALPVEPFILAALLVVMLPATVGVTAAVDGRSGVRALLARALRWRFGAGWWTAVLVGLPGAAVAVGLVTGRTLHLDDAGSVLGGAVVSAGSALLLVNLWEETVWAGFLQTRLQERYGFWRAAALTAVAFAGFHVPLQFASAEVTVASVVVDVGALVVLGLLMRVMVGVVLTATAGSVLAVAVLHAVFNASTAEDDLVDQLVSGTGPLPVAVPAVVLFTAAAAAIVLRTRRLTSRRR